MMVGRSRNPLKRINFHSIAELAVSDCISHQMLSIPDVRQSYLNTESPEQYQKVRMEPSPADSLFTTVTMETPETSSSCYSHPVNSIHSDEQGDSSGPSSSDRGSAEKFKKYRKQRTVFETNQLKLLENTFNHNCYPSSEEYEALSKKTAVDEHRLRIWFQNRRARQKRSCKRISDVSSMQHVACHHIPNLPSIPQFHRHHMASFYTTPKLYYAAALI